MSIKNDKPVILLGAGLSGSLMAVYLAQRGFRVDIYERRPDMRKADISAGKSINLAISVRGLSALRGVGMEEAIRDICIPMRGRMMHSLEGELTYQPYASDGVTAINSVSRGDLNMKLMDLAESYENINLKFNQRSLSMDMRTGEVLMRDENTQETYTVSGQTVIACDGAFSGVRGSMIKTPRFDFSQKYLSHSYKELTIPPGEGGSWQMEKNALHIWPRGHFMLIALPNLDGSYTVTLFYPNDGENSFETLNTEEEVKRFFNENFQDSVPLMPELVKDFFENPTGDLVTIKCNPWHFEDKICLVGDAAHAVVPFFGQGMNAAFEDCEVLDACLEGFDGDWGKVFEKYSARRVANGQAIADMAIDNYIEMRDNVGDEQWLFRKKVEHKLEEAFPGKYISRYEAVSFTQVPYAEALARAEINHGILDRLVEGIDDVDDVDMELAEQLINDQLADYFNNPRDLHSVWTL